MYKNKKIGLIIRAHNEEKFLPSVLNSIPAFIDRIYLVNDASTDRTLEVVTEIAKKDGRIVIINHERRMGAGQGAISGHKKAIEGNNDIVVLIDGDGQMDTSLIPYFLDPLSNGEADYVKGNRFSSKEHLKSMPGFRVFGNYLLTILTRISSGYWNISDPQNGYVAVTINTLKKIDLDKVCRGFAYENDMLVKLNLIRARVVEIPHPAIYKDETSKIRYPRFIVSTSWLLLKDFIWRIWRKYFFRA